jgi:hypothetical protein
MDQVALAGKLLDCIIPALGYLRHTIQYMDMDLSVKVIILRRFGTNTSCTRTFLFLLYLAITFHAFFFFQLPGRQELQGHQNTRNTSQMQ